MVAKKLRLLFMDIPTAVAQTADPASEPKIKKWQLVVNISNQGPSQVAEGTVQIV